MSEIDTTQPESDEQGLVTRIEIFLDHEEEAAMKAAGLR